MGNVMENVMGNSMENVLGNVMENVMGKVMVNVMGNRGSTEHIIPITMEVDHPSLQVTSLLWRRN
jgi:hypothetical protein